ncbi:hypothetical protein OCK74_11960 [Chitinophagaceae bacterium LB-8]|uniref:Nal1 C-terminal domain-containing protein n=1 Tax=Paraflavisolibacter caeni TaxID=2982496 RepID=A0A9X2XVC6_9BACT|nr:hypothetical protein [Paraflavisolibacter caeni]MCU7549836.1 hypothetical protein [Paraflavisolibacter caeni]
MQNKTNSRYNFSSLSIKDLIEARDTFHAHLINKRNVVATAIGRYLIREEDIDMNGSYRPLHSGSKRTIENSCVIDISWPCILVFVNKWEDDADLIKQGASNIVPRSVFMPDGRVVPICVVEAPQNNTGSNLVNFDKLIFPTNLVGGGFPVIVNVQGSDHVATVACLVTDGHSYFALTNKHVTGESAEEIETLFGNKPIVIGISSGKAISKAEFARWYPEWAVKNMQVNCDVGLIKVSDINRWKTAILEIGELDELYDLNTFNLDLSLIATYTFKNGEDKKEKLPAGNGLVRGYGAISHLTEGQILALFYRYKSVGGVEYVSDFLIGGRNGQTLRVDYGDSGMLWLLETIDENNKPKLQPFALHWGQHQFFVGNQKKHFSYSMSTALSNICRELDVELVRGCNVALDYSWGKVGHYSVGSLAIDCILNENLAALMRANINNISFQSRKITRDLAAKDNPDLSKNPDEGFCPLADVPDIIWKQSKSYIDKEGNPKGFEWGRKGDENPNHYADADYVTENGNLYDFCPTAADLTVQTWQHYYNEVDKAMGHTPDAREKKKRGLLCFRVWQIFDYMVAALKNREHDKFIFGAGVLAHYVGDACQPLHSSFMSDGDPADNETIMYTPPRGGSRHPKGIPYEKIINPGNGVHVAYEDNMIDDFIHVMLPKIKEIINDNESRIMQELLIPIGNGQEAGFAVLQLMKVTQTDINPKDIVEVYKKAKGHQNIAKELHDEFGELTVECMARGCRVLAAIWNAAWDVSQTTSEYKRSISQDKLIALYRNPDELPSLHLDTIENILVK